MSHYLNVLADASSKGSVLVSIDNAPSQLQLTLLCIRQHILKGPVWVALYNVSHPYELMRRTLLTD